MDLGLHDHPVPHKLVAVLGALQPHGRIVGRAPPAPNLHADLSVRRFRGEGPFSGVLFLVEVHDRQGQRAAGLKVAPKPAQGFAGKVEIGHELERA